MNQSRAHLATLDDQQLMVELAGGEEAAFDELYRRYAQRLLNFVYRFVAMRAEAEELTQDIFVRVFKARHRYQPKARLSTWIYTIATNVCLKRLKRREWRAMFGAIRAGGTEEGAQAQPFGGQGVEGIEDPMMQGAEKAVMQLQERDEVRREVQKLPANQRAAVILRCYSDMGHEEIASVLGTSVQAVKSLLHRAYRGLEKKLGGVYGTE